MDTCSRAASHFALSMLRLGGSDKWLPFQTRIMSNFCGSLPTQLRIVIIQWYIVVGVVVWCIVFGRAWVKTHREQGLWKYVSSSARRVLLIAPQGLYSRIVGITLRLALSTLGPLMGSWETLRRRRRSGWPCPSPIIQGPRFEQHCHENGWLLAHWWSGLLGR